MEPKTIVLISGANQGIGFEIAKKLATEQSHWHIWIGSRDVSKGNDAAESLASLPSTVQAIQLDVTSDESISTCASTIEKTHGRLDVLINNAGIGPSTINTEPTLRQRFAKALDTNVYGAAVLTDACIPLLQRSSLPRIIFISSEMGSLSNALDPGWTYYGLAHLVEYKSSKAAMNMLGATYAVRYGKEGFKVNMCCPGLRSTNFTGGVGGPPSEGAINACRLAVEGKDGSNGTFSNLEGPMDW